MAYIGLIKR